MYMYLDFHHLLKLLTLSFCVLELHISTVKPVHVYNNHSREPENVAFMSSCPLYTG